MTEREQFWLSYLESRTAYIASGPVRDRPVLPLMEKSDVLALYDEAATIEDVQQRNLALGVILEDAIVPR